MRDPSRRGSSWLKGVARDEFLLSLGDRRRRSTDELRRDRRDVFLGNLSGADRCRHGLVACRYRRCDDAELPGHGVGCLCLGCRKRSLRRADRRPGRGVAARACARIGKQSRLASSVPADLRHYCRCCCQRLFRPHDGSNDRVVRGGQRPRRIAGVCRHGRRADDGIALRTLSHLGL